MEDNFANQFESWILELNLELVKFKNACAKDINWISMLNNHVWSSANVAQFKFKNMFKEIKPWTTTWLSLVKQTNILLSLTTLMMYFNQDNIDIYLAAVLRAKLLLATRETIIKEWQYILSSELNDRISNPNLLSLIYDCLPKDIKPVATTSKQLKNLDETFSVFHRKNDVKFEDEELFKAVVENSLLNVPFIKLKKIAYNYDVAQKIKEIIYGMKYISLSKLNLLYAVNLKEPKLQEKINTIIDEAIELKKIKVKMRTKLKLDDDMYEEILQRNLDRRKKEIAKILNNKRFGNASEQPMEMVKNDEFFDPNKCHHPLFYFECEDRFNLEPRLNGPDPKPMTENYDHLKIQEKDIKPEKHRIEFNWINVGNIQNKFLKAKEEIMKQDKNS